jgi:hypothetical protein
MWSPEHILTVTTSPYTIFILQWLKKDLTIPIAHHELNFHKTESEQYNS